MLLLCLSCSVSFGCFYVPYDYSYYYYLIFYFSSQTPLFRSKSWSESTLCLKP